MLYVEPCTVVFSFHFLANNVWAGKVLGNLALRANKM